MQENTNQTVKLPPQKYWLPNRDDPQNADEHPFVGQSVILVGGNGAGKSKLGAWIEKRNTNMTHRIAPQRNLCLSDNPHLMSYEDAEKFILNGQGDNRDGKWEWGRRYTTHLVSDFDPTIAAVVSLEHNQLNQFKNEYRLAEQAGQPAPQLETTTAEQLCSLWNALFPQRELIEQDSKFFAHLPDGTTNQYPATEMSDGERGVLYLAAQILALKGARIVIVDEPEIHLHGSIMNRLWTEIEKARPDCRFVYITHDIDFAATHVSAEKYWIKSFDGTKWDYERIEDEALPQDLLMEVLGARKNVLFVEGVKDSLDKSLYTLLLPSFVIVPCGNCMNVVEYTKAFSRCPMLSWCKVRGIVDRDYRTDQEIEALSKQNVFTCDVAEIENLFVVDPLIKAIAQQLNKTPEQTVQILEQIHGYINELFSGQRLSQMNNALKSAIKHQLTTIDVSDVHDGESLADLIRNMIRMDEINVDIDKKFPADMASMTSADILRVFNNKGLSKTVGRFLGLDSSRYRETVLCMMGGWSNEKRRAVFKSVFPFKELEA